MTFSWKKMKISVSDHLQNQKRGRSLVVETGFPTSLIDLFVKNRDRLKKSSKKKASKKKRSIPDPVVDSDAELLNQIIRDADTPSIPETAEVENDSAIQESVKKINPNWIRVGVLKMFLVVILGLGTQRFAVWITLSAFLLFFLDYMGTQFSRIFNKRSSDSQKIGKLGFERSVVSASPILIENSELNPSIADSNIQQEPESNLSPRTETIRSVIDSEDNYSETCEISRPFDAKHRNLRKSKMAKVGSKMKKLFPKKLRKSKKQHFESESLIDNSIEVDQSEEINQEQEQCEVKSEDQISIEEVVSGPDSFSKSSVTKVYNDRDLKATKVAEHESKMERVGNLRYWFICLIVLAGLVGGKISALGLTLIWCLILKTGGILRKPIRVPLYRTSLNFST